MDIEWNPYSSSEVHREQIEQISGVLLFVFIALIAADHFTRDQTQNWSITQGVPVPMKKQWRLRSGYMWAIVWAAILLGIIVSYMFSLFFETRGSLVYPIGIYVNGAIHYISLWQYSVLLIGLNMMLSYVLLLFTTGLSWMIRNIYLTILLVVGVFFLPNIWQFITPITSWQPSIYMDLLSVLQGERARSTGLSTIEFWKIPIVLIVLMILLEWVFSRVFSLIPTKTLGLNRRENK